MLLTICIARAVRPWSSNSFPSSSRSYASMTWRQCAMKPSTITDLTSFLWFCKPEAKWHILLANFALSRFWRWESPVDVASFSSFSRFPMKSNEENIGGRDVIASTYNPRCSMLEPVFRNFAIVGDAIRPFKFTRAGTPSGGIMLANSSGSSSGITFNNFYQMMSER